MPDFMTRPPYSIFLRVSVRRLRAGGVNFEDRQDLLGHRSGRITTHYSSAELQNLYEATNRVCEKQKSGVVLTLLGSPKFKVKQKESPKVISFDVCQHIPKKSRNGFLREW